MEQHGTPSGSSYIPVTSSTYADFTTAERRKFILTHNSYSQHFKKKYISKVSPVRAIKAYGKVKPDVCHYPELDQSSPCPSIQILEDQF
jgi:hypothetical protein